MKLKFISVSALLLSACQTTQSTDPSLLTFKIPDGSTLALNKDIEVPEYKTHAAFQAGKSTTDRKRNLYQLNCRFDVKEFGPRTIKPESFTIRRTEDGSEWFSHPTIMRFYTILYLDSTQRTDVVKLQCQRWGSSIDRNFTVAEMAAALGNVFSFSYKESK